MKKFNDISLVLAGVGCLFFVITALINPSIFAFKISLVMLIPYYISRAIKIKEVATCKRK